MTAQLLINELANIIQESKRKYTELRNAAEKSLSDLKSLPSTSEAQLAADLRRRSYFINPFTLACKTGNARLALLGTSCLQKLVVFGGLSRDRLEDVIGAFQECNKIGLDVQLKILQSLPSLLQGYQTALEGDLQANLFRLCTSLQQVKTIAVSSTASATLQQVVTFLYEKVEAEDARSDETLPVAELDLNGEKIVVKSAAYDAFRIFQDLCFLTEGQKPEFVGNANISQSFGLELIEAILTNHGDLFESHREQAHVLCERAVPLVTHLLSERTVFSVTVRTVRILCIMLREHLGLLGTDLEIPLSLLSHMLEADASTPWRRALCMETFRVIFSTPNLAINIYQLFDGSQNRKNVVQNCLANFVRLASEKPTLIGVGQQSSFPDVSVASKVASQEQAAIEAGNVTGIISGDIGIAEANSPGISTEWSTMRIPCLDQLDKTEPPQIPETYIYSLILVCINNLADGLAKSILPLTAQTLERNRHRSKSKSKQRTTNGHQNDKRPPEGNLDTDQEDSERKRQPRFVPLNPLDLEDHPSIENVRTTANLVNNCWPAILATLSTFLYAALDADYYRGLVRSFQRLTQVAGLLRLVTPQDAFLTALAKGAVPPSARRNNSIIPSPSIMSISSPKIGSTMETLFGQAPTEMFSRSNRTSLDLPGSSLSQRNLMCLRALLNLAIALGPVLEASWSIIFENLQKADDILTHCSTGTATSAQDYKSNASEHDREGGESGTAQTSVGSEITAVEAAIHRLFQATSEYPNSSFISIVTALSALALEEPESDTSFLSPISPMSQRRQPSVVSMTSLSIPSSQTKDKRFAVSKLGDLARVNIQRLAFESEEGGWTILVQKLQEIAFSSVTEANIRVKVAEILGNIAVGTALVTMSEQPKLRIAAQRRSLACLQDLLATLHERMELANPTNIDMHRIGLESLHSILDQCGEALLGGWASILAIIASALGYSTSESQSNNLDKIDYVNSPTSTVDLRLVKSAFGSVQLICSDFLPHLPPRSTIKFFNILSAFCSQPADINISLTSISLFWRLSDFFKDMLPDDESLNPIEHLRHAIEPLKSESANFTVNTSLALWMILQQRLASMTYDDRVDLRNGLVHTAFRILRNCNGSVSTNIEIWYFKNVITKMLRLNFTQQTQGRGKGVDFDLSYVNGLSDTSQNIIKGISSFLSTRLLKLSKSDSFTPTWMEVLDQFASLLDLGAHELSFAIFAGLSQILQSIDRPEDINVLNPLRLWSIWINNAPQPVSESNEHATNLGDALLAYLRTGKQIYRLTSSKLQRDQLAGIIDNFSACVELSRGTSRSSDIDVLTTIQKEILECFDMVILQSIHIPSLILPKLGIFTTLPYSQGAEHSKKGNNAHTCVAFAKQSMDIAFKLVESNIANEDIYTSGTINTLLENLSQSIQRKYSWQLQGKGLSLWRKASKAAVSILGMAIPTTAKLAVDAVIVTRLFETAITVSRLIASAPDDFYPQTSILVDDEMFDIESLDILKDSLMSRRTNRSDVFNQLVLEEDIAPFQSIREEYVNGLFNSSLVHPKTSDLDVHHFTLQELYTIPHSQIHDPPFDRRVRMCYHCFDELFALTSASRASIDSPHSDLHSPLASTAFPELIVRCALPLKRYIADQPLRGRMPTPASQRFEILYILNKIKDFECIPALDVPSFSSSASSIGSRTQRKHLEWLMPLVNNCLPHAREDKEIADALHKVMDIYFQP